MANLHLSANWYPWWSTQDSVGTSLSRNCKNGNSCRRPFEFK